LVIPINDSGVLRNVARRAPALGHKSVFVV
jgi:hypothetical protein